MGNGRRTRRKIGNWLFLVVLLLFLLQDRNEKRQDEKQEQRKEEERSFWLSLGLFLLSAISWLEAEQDKEEEDETKKGLKMVGSAESCILLINRRGLKCFFSQSLESEKSSSSPSPVSLALSALVVVRNLSFPLVSVFTKSVCSAYNELHLSSSSCRSWVSEWISENRRET